MKNKIWKISATNDVTYQYVNIMGYSASEALDTVLTTVASAADVTEWEIKLIKEIEPETDIELALDKPINDIEALKKVLEI